eukprot:scaffold255549_cov26-Prasinocladus_malaysianus.AAC.2
MPFIWRAVSGKKTSQSNGKAVALLADQAWRGNDATYQLWPSGHASRADDRADNRSGCVPQGLVRVGQAGQHECPDVGFVLIR